MAPLLWDKEREWSLSPPPTCFNWAKDARAQWWATRARGGDGNNNNNNNNDVDRDGDNHYHHHGDVMMGNKGQGRGVLLLWSRFCILVVWKTHPRCLITCWKVFYKWMKIYLKNGRNSTSQNVLKRPWRLIPQMNLVWYGMCQNL